MTFGVCPLSDSIMFPRFIYIVTWVCCSLLFHGLVRFHCSNIAHFDYFSSIDELGCFYLWVIMNNAVNDHSGAGFTWIFPFLDTYHGVNFWIIL